MTTTFDAYLTADHRACDVLLGKLRQSAIAGEWSAARGACAALSHDLLAHFAAEEEVLFPAFEARTGMRNGPTQVMRTEHAEVRELLADLTDAAAGGDVEGVRGYAEPLLILLQQHNMKEEHILYPRALAAAGDEAPDLTAWIVKRREA